MPALDVEVTADQYAATAVRINFFEDSETLASTSELVYTVVQDA